MRVRQSEIETSLSPGKEKEANVHGVKIAERREEAVEGRIDFQERRNRRAAVPSISGALEKTPLVTRYRSGDIIRRDQSFLVLHLRQPANHRGRTGIGHLVEIDRYIVITICQM